MKYHPNHTVFPVIHIVVATPQLPSNMQTPTPPPSSTPTTKRKRPVLSSGRGASPSPSRLKTTNLPSRPLGPLDADFVSEASPHTAVTGHLQTLDIQEQDVQISKLDFGSGTRNNHTAGHFAPQISLPSNQLQYESGPVTPPPSSHSCQPNSNSFPAHTSSLGATDYPQVLEIPDSPSSTAASRTVLPEVPTPDPRLGNKSPVHTTNPPASASNPSSPRSLWWTDMEITGHNPSDPTDDGYGINGVGFIPTPAMATARAEKRRRQVREWKEREAREARVRRGQRRQRNRAEIGEAVGGKVGRNDGHNGGKKEDVERKVRFSVTMDTEI